MIKINNLVKKYDNIVIGPINTSLEDETLHVIIGSSGAGKSTIIKLIYGLIKSDTGNVEVNEERISYISQKAMLFNHLTIRDNLLLQKLDISNIGEYISSLKLPNNILDQYPFEISGGQAQRVNFLRVLLENAKIVLLDEAFSALDVSSKEEIYVILKDIKCKYKLTVILVTHDLYEAIVLCDKIHVVDNGQIAFEGTKKQLFDSKNSVVTQLLKSRKKYLRSLLDE